MIALITKRNNPKVKKVTGMVRITKTGFKKVFKSDKATAIKTAAV